MMLDAGRSILYSALKNLKAKWDGVEPLWHDTMRRQFVQEVWEPLQKNSAITLEAIDQLEVMLIQMRRECEGQTDDIFQGE